MEDVIVYILRSAVSGLGMQLRGTVLARHGKWIVFFFNSIQNWKMEVCGNILSSLLGAEAQFFPLFADHRFLFGMA